MRPISPSPVLTIHADRARPALELIESDPVRVVIVDAQPVFRAGFAAMLEAEPDMEVAGMAGSPEEAADLVATVHPHVALIALDLPGLGGLDAVRRIAQDPGSADVHLIVLAAQDGGEDLFAALRDGASGFLPKSTASDELVQAVRVVAAGDAFLPPSETRRLIAEFRSRPHANMPTSDQLDELTAREREVVALVAAGLRNDEIAEHLVISLATVKTHVSRALRKLDAHDRSQLVAIAYQRGIVGMGASARLRAVPARRLAAAAGGSTVRRLA